MRGWALIGVVLLAGCGGSPQATSRPAEEFAAVECAPFARQLSGIQLFGDAASWWDQAEGGYARGQDPVEGGVLVFRRSGLLPSGHVSVVARRVSDSEILVTQANWVHHRITRDEPVMDVSAAHDWSEVRVWWAPAHAMGATTYPTYGFIAPGPAAGRDVVAGR